MTTNSVNRMTQIDLLDAAIRLHHPELRGKRSNAGAILESYEAAIRQHEAEQPPEMMERVAFALWQVDAVGLKSPRTLEQWQAESDETRVKWARKARAAVDAMHLSGALSDEDLRQHIRQPITDRAIYNRGDKEYIIDRKTLFEAVEVAFKKLRPYLRSSNAEHRHDIDRAEVTTLAWYALCYTPDKNTQTQEEVEATLKEVDRIARKYSQIEARSSIEGQAS